jgi:hypothetical protein
MKYSQIPHTCERIGVLLIFDNKNKTYTFIYELPL